MLTPNSYSSNPYEAYVNGEILNADPIRLVQMLYQAALDAVGAGRRHLASGEIAARSNSISKAVEIVQELNQSLNFEAGGEISRNLAALYDYVQRRLLEANIQQADAPLAEVERLLAPLLEAWTSCLPAAAAEHHNSSEMAYSLDAAY